MPAEAAPNPYVWQGDVLIHGPSGAMVGTVGDIPQLVRMRQLHWPDTHKPEGAPNEGSAGD